VEDGLGLLRQVAERARATWERARAGGRGPSDPAPEARRASLQASERDYRRRLEALRAAEAQRYAEKDRALDELRRRAEVRPRRTLVATAYWRCV
jgi:hypothetical protein